jgi:ATP-dependent DNA helicase RecG
MFKQITLMEKASELIEKLNVTDETTKIEAKRGAAIDRSILETVCAFSNEPALDGGYLLLGVARDQASLFSSYEIIDVGNPDKLQADLSSQCACSFNQPIRPEIEVEIINGKRVLKIFIPELPVAQKPVFFKNEGLPRGAYRRIGSTDQRCSEDDLILFFNHNETFDCALVKGSSWIDIDEDAIKLYRSFRSRVNPYAEELAYDDEELLLSLGSAMREAGNLLLTYTGLLVFGTKQAQRRLIPAMRVDYIRVPGNEWIENPENRFNTVDMRGSLLSLVGRMYNTIADDLPKGFLLPEGELQAESIGLPGRVLREALVNAFMHRSYRMNQPIQVIRYGNRIEIRNPGFSLKPEDQLGEPGSQQRNPYIAAVFHETNLAETKGSGIRTMRKLMEQAKMVPPTFESDHNNNQFTVRLLLHHFLNEFDLAWLSALSDVGFTDSQKRALVFVREVGAIDNATYRQLNGSDIFKASTELRQLRDFGLIEAKGRGRATYYVPREFLLQIPQLVGNVGDQSTPLLGQSPTLSDGVKTLSDQALSLSDQVPKEIQEKIAKIGKRSQDKELIKEVMCDLCKWQPLSLRKLSEILGRNDKYLLEYYVTPLREEGRLLYTIPDMPSHPDQAYQTKR